MHAEDLMTRVVHACRAQDTLAEAARTMWDCDVGWLPVMDEKGVLVSAVTDRDICMGALFQGLSLSQSRVASVMSRRLVACSPEADVADIEATLRREQLRRLPVVSHDGHLIGVVTLSDVVRGLEREIDPAELLGSTAHPALAAGSLPSDVNGVAALADVVDKSRALYQSCSHALEATETLAKISEPRGERGERVELFKKVANDAYYHAPDGDDVWIYE